MSNCVVTSVGIRLHVPLQASHAADSAGRGAAAAVVYRGVFWVVRDWREGMTVFRFTIRDMLWLMVVVALACGWLAEHRWVTTRSLHDKFTIEADRWEAWCDEISFSSTIDHHDHPSF